MCYRVEWNRSRSIRGMGGTPMSDAPCSEALHQETQRLLHQWTTDSRWAGIQRDYTAGDVIRLRGSIRVEHTLATLGAARLWHLLQTEGRVAALGAMTGG